MMNFAPKVLSARILPIFDSDTDPFSVVSKAFAGLFVRDRFDILNKYSPYRISDAKDEIPTPFETPIPFADIMDQTAVDMIKKADGGKIIVCWSGGVDSTGVVVALLKHLQDKSQLHVYCAPTSLEEYPKFYNDILLKQGITVTVTDSIVDDISDEDCAVITSGWCADQLFGSDTNLRIPDSYHKHWVEGINDLYMDFHGGRVKLSSGSLDVIESVYQDYANRFGLTLTEYCEFAWLFNFGCKFTFVQDCMKHYLVSSKNRDRCEPFYEKKDFQRWAVGCFSRIKEFNGYKDPINYKLPIKQYISEYTGDIVYLYTKRKQNSWGMLSNNCEHFISVRCDGEYVLFSKLGVECTSSFDDLFVSASKYFRKEESK